MTLPGLHKTLRHPPPAIHKEPSKPLAPQEGFASDSNSLSCLISHLKHLRHSPKWSKHLNHLVSSVRPPVPIAGQMARKANFCGKQVWETWDSPCVLMFELKSRTRHRYTSTTSHNPSSTNSSQKTNITAKSSSLNPP